MKVRTDTELLDLIESTKSYPFPNWDGWMFLVHERGKIRHHCQGATARQALSIALQKIEDESEA